MTTDLTKEHIYIDGKPINKNVAKHSDELLKALKNMLTVFEGDMMHPQGSIESIRCIQAREAIKNALS